MIKTWFKIFFRNSQKNWLNVAVNILGLTLGIAGLILVLLYINDEKSYNAWNPHKNKIYRIANIFQNGEIWHVGTTAQKESFLEEIPEVEATIMISPFYSERMVVANDVSQFMGKITQTEKDFFDFFPFEVLQGSVEEFEKAPHHIALSDEVVRLFFKDLNPLGKTIKIAETEYLIALIYKKPPHSHFEPQFIIQFDELLAYNWGNYNYELFCKISPQADINFVTEKMDEIMLNKFTVEQAETAGLTLAEYIRKYDVQKIAPEPLVSIRLHHKAENSGPEGMGNYQLLMVLLGLSVLLISISAVNFINLSTASATQRAKEIGVKKTLGLSKTQLSLQYILEIVFQGLISMLLALILVEVLLPYFNDFIDKSLSLNNGVLLFKILLLTIGITSLAGILPAIYLANFKAVEVLKGNYSRSKKGIIVRHIMLALQFIISGFFLIGVMVIYSQVSFMMEKDPGFNEEQVLIVNLNESKNEYDKYQRVKKILIDNPNIEAISSCLIVPGFGYVSGTNFTYGDESFNTSSNVMDVNYLEFAGVELVKGRYFSSNLASDTNRNVIINETAARLAGIYDDPIGKVVDLGWYEGKNMTIIGVVKDYHINGFDQEIYPMFMVTWENFDFVQNWVGHVQFKIKAGRTVEAISAIETFWMDELEPNYPFTYHFMNEQFALNYETYQQQKIMFFILSVVVIITSLLGLFALSTLSIQQRFKEVAIRKTLGAPVKEIIFQLVKSFLKITVISSIILLPLAYYAMQNWLSNFVYRIEMPIWPYIVAPVVLLGLVFLVVGGQAYQATRVNLIQYLKFE
jgi:putative ABC transport system permease protein